MNEICGFCESCKANEIYWIVILHLFRLGRSVYHLAAYNGDVLLLKKILDYSRWNLDIKDVNEMSALHHAVLSGEAACVKLLLDNNCPVDIKDNENRTALLLSIQESSEKIATILVTYGVNINVQDNLGRLVWF